MNHQARKPHHSELDAVLILSKLYSQARRVLTSNCLDLCFNVRKFEF